MVKLILCHYEYIQIQVHRFLLVVKITVTMMTHVMMSETLTLPTPLMMMMMIITSKLFLHISLGVLLKKSQNPRKTRIGQITPTHPPYPIKKKN